MEPQASAFHRNRKMKMGGTTNVQDVERSMSVRQKTERTAGRSSVFVM